MDSPPSANAFATTRWSVVLAAGASGTESLAALETLCRACWPPVYAYIRRLGKDADQSRDLTQAFFAHLLANRSFAAAHPERGRFRSYLLGALKHFLADVHDRADAQKRGGGREILSLDALAAEETYSWEPSDESTPERIFERRWALTLMARALQRLEEECRLSGKAHLFASLKGFLTEGAAAQAYPDTARELGLTEANVRMMVTRLRRRYGELVRAEVAETLGAHADLDDEMRHLLRLLRGE
jgi:RNA polymerase sigma-70 factor (ECF subfamily)